MAEFEAIVAGDARGLAGEAQFVKHRIHEVAGAVAREGAACAVGSVCAGSEAEDEDTGARISEARDGTDPVGLVLIGAAFGFADAAAVVAEAGAAFAIDDGFVDLLQERRKSAGAVHCIP